METSKPKQEMTKPRRSAAMTRVYFALLRDRRNLRRAARYAGNPNMKRRLRRLAFRRFTQASELAETAPLGEAPADGPNELASLSRDIGQANEISTVAACLRSNRKLRIAIERALASHPSDRAKERLNRLRDESNAEAGLLEARMRDIATRGFAGSPPIVE